MIALRTARTRLRTWWRELPAREQRLVAIAGVVVALALLWWVALAPALRQPPGQARPWGRARWRATAPWRRSRSRPADPVARCC